jgi:hypothetical protein
LKETQLGEATDRRHDGVPSGVGIDVEGTGEVVDDLMDRTLPIAPLPDETGSRVELVNAASHPIEHERFVIDDPDS